MKIHGYLMMLLTATPLLMSAATAQDQIFIYGKIYTEDGHTYEGAIRWGKEEVYWTDIFNAQKEKNDNLRHLSSEERDELEDRQHREWHNWGTNLSRWTGWHVEEGDKDFIHQFSCQFGEIKSITPQGKE